MQLTQKNGSMGTPWAAWGLRAWPVNNRAYRICIAEVKHVGSEQPCWSNVWEMWKPHIAYDIWYMIYDICYITYHILYMICDIPAHLFAGRACEQWIHMPTVCLVDQAGWVSITYPPPSWLDVSGEQNRILMHGKRVTKQTSVTFFESTSNTSKFAQTWKANTILSIWAIH